MAVADLDGAEEPVSLVRIEPPGMRTAQKERTQMKILIVLIFCLILALSVSACTPLPEAAFPSGSASSPASTESTVPPTGSPEPAGDRRLEIAVGGRVFTAELEDNAAADALISLLPAAFDMQELNGNEKYRRIPDFQFPVDPSVPDEIRTGDLYLYQDNCIVLFYETFATSYQYTPLGRILDPEGLAEAVGSGDVTVEMSLQAG